MTIIEITEQEFWKLSKLKDTYFQNGCIFLKENDNLLAFQIIKEDNTFTYWELAE